jgi:uncharacterized membrane protein YjgN (DUF898 family)
MFNVFMKGFGLSIITLGIYLPWLMANVITEVSKNLKFGNIRFEFVGNGGDLLVIHLKGMLLYTITLGLYLFRYRSNYHNYIIDNIKIYQDNVEGTFKATTTGMGYFKLLVGNFFIIILTLGLGTPIAMVRSLKYFASTTSVLSCIDFDNIAQGEIEETDAIGEGLMDTFELDLI